MKKRLHPFYAVIMAGALMVSVSASAYVPGSGIENTPHDFSKGSAYYPTGMYNPEGESRICIFCHIPKTTLAERDMNSIPIWNHAASTITSYSLYSNGTAEPGNISHRSGARLSTGPGPSSMFCLSCHDGTVAVNRYGTVSGDRMIRDSYQIGAGGVLANQHPVGFLFAAVDDTEIDQNAQIGRYSVSELLREGRMECTTCHDVHNYGNSGEKFLRVSDRNSGLCCSCHLKCSR